MTQAQTQERVEQKTNSFSLPNYSVVVEFIKVQKGNITNPKHVLFGGMGEGAKRRLVPRRSKTTFKYISVLTKEEQNILEDKLALPEDGLSVYRTENNYWDSVKIDLTKEGTHLNLSNPVDYIKYKVVLSYDDLVAASLSERKLKNKLTYQFVIVRPGDKSSETLAVYNVKKEAYKLAGMLEQNIEHVKEFLYLAGIRSTSNASIAWLKSKLGQMVEDEPQKVVDILTSSDYSTRALISRGVLSGVIKDSGGKFHLEDGVALCNEGDIPSLSNAIKFLSSDSNSDIKTLIQAKIGK